MQCEYFYYFDTRFHYITNAALHNERINAVKTKRGGMNYYYLNTRERRPYCEFNVSVILSEGKRRRFFMKLVAYGLLGRS